MLICRLYIACGEMSTQYFANIFSGLYSLIEFEFFIYVECKFFIRYLFCNYFLSFHAKTFHFLTVSFEEEKFFIFTKSNSSIISFTAHHSYVLPKEKKLSPIFSTNFKVPYLTFRSVT